MSNTSPRKLKINLNINKFLEEFYKECSQYTPKQRSGAELKKLSEVELGIQNCANYLGRAIFTEEFGLRKKHRVDLLVKMVTLNPEEKQSMGNINVTVQSVERGILDGLDVVDVTSEINKHEELPKGEK